MDNKEMTIEVPVEENEPNKGKTKKSLTETFKRIGSKIKSGTKTVVDSTPFRVITGVVSTITVGAIALIATGVIGGSDDDDVDALPEGDTIELVEDFEVTEVGDYETVE